MGPLPTTRKLRLDEKQAAAEASPSADAEAGPEAGGEEVVDAEFSEVDGDAKNLLRVCCSTFGPGGTAGLGWCMPPRHRDPARSLHDESRPMTMTIAIIIS